MKAADRNPLQLRAIRADSTIRAGLRFEPVSTDDQLHALAAMAREIWREYYVPLIGRHQVDYMLEKFQSFSALRQCLRDGQEYFFIRPADPAGFALGYLAIQNELDCGCLFLSKLYVLAGFRGMGVGRQALMFIEELARARGLVRIWLTVNKGNPARRVYERAGYIAVEAVVMDIGSGFAMDDYRMEKFLV